MGHLVTVPTQPQPRLALLNLPSFILRSCLLRHSAAPSMQPVGAGPGPWWGPWHVQSPEVEDTALRPQPQGSPAITPGSCLPEAPATQTQHLRPLTSECALSPSLLMGRKVSVPQTGPQVVLCTMCQPTVREHQPRLESRITGTVLASTVA